MALRAILYQSMKIDELLRLLRIHTIVFNAVIVYNVATVYCRMFPNLTPKAKDGYTHLHVWSILANGQTKHRILSCTGSIDTLARQGVHAPLPPHDLSLEKEARRIFPMRHDAGIRHRIAYLTWKQYE